MLGNVLGQWREIAFPGSRHHWSVCVKDVLNMTDLVKYYETAGVIKTCFICESIYYSSHLLSHSFTYEFENQDGHHAFVCVFLDCSTFQTFKPV